MRHRILSAAVLNALCIAALSVLAQYGIVPKELSLAMAVVIGGLLGLVTNRLLHGRATQRPEPPKQVQPLRPLRA